MIRFSAKVATAAAILAIAGCGGQLSRTILPNRGPEIRAEQASVAPPDDHSYAVRVSWVATDADGRIDHVVYAVDPLSVDRVDDGWVRTTAMEQVLAFPLPPARPPSRSCPPSTSS